MTQLKKVESFSMKQAERLSELTQVLLNNAEYVLHDWLPDGELVGEEYKARNPRRDDTQIGSFSININSGLWADFATNDTGADLVELFGYLNDLTEPEALLNSVNAYCEEHQLTATKKMPATKKVKKEKPPTEVVPATEMTLLPPDYDVNGNTVTGTWEYRTLKDEVLFYVLRVDLPDGKETKPCRLSAGKWVWSYPEGKFPLYNVHKLTSGAVVLFSEGEKVATHLDSFGACIGMTSAGGSNRLLASDLSALKKASSVIVFPDADAAGVKYAAQVVWYGLGAGVEVNVLDTNALDWKNGEDAADHPELSWNDYQSYLIPSKTWLEKHNDIADEALFTVIGGISDAEYDRMLGNFATKAGLTKRTLNSERKQRLKVEFDETEEVEVISEAKQKMLDFFGVPEIADDEQSTDLLLQEMVDLIERHVALQRYQTVTIAAWILSSYLYDSFNIFPRLGIISPMKRCGKTTLLETIAGICNKPLPTANISAAAVFRTLETYSPTLMIDEADILLGRDPNSELIGILNSGHIRSACVIRLVGDTHEPQRFSVWSPVIFATIRDLPNDALMDRTIAIRLERRKQGEKLYKLPISHKEDYAVLRGRLVKWAMDNEAAVKANHILPPEIANDRAMDNWLPLFTVAGLASEYWQAEVEASYKALNQYIDDEAVHNLLLKDIRDLFNSNHDAGKLDKLSSQQLIMQLLKLEHRPWVEIHHGRSLTAYSLAKMLKDFQIEPKVLRLDSGKQARGYSVEMFTDVFERYLS
jgi:hypothetical protein